MAQITLHFPKKEIRGALVIRDVETVTADENLVLQAGIRNIANAYDVEISKSVQLPTDIAHQHAIVAAEEETMHLGAKLRRAGLNGEADAITQKAWRAFTTELAAHSPAARDMKKVFTRRPVFMRHSAMRRDLIKKLSSV